MSTDVLHIGIHAEQRPDQPAIIMAATSKVVTYRELNERSKKLAFYLRANGMKAGDHVALLMRNCEDYMVAVWAARRSGMYFTPVNWHLTTEEVAYIVDDCDAQCLVASEAEVPMAQEVVAQLPRVTVCLTTGPATGRFKSLQEIYAADVSGEAPLAEQEGQAMFYSSGTTGRPKGIKRPLDGTPFGTAGLADKLTGGVFGFTSNDVQLAVAPLYHAAPLGWAMGAQRMGSTVVVMDRFDPLETVQLIERYKVTHVQFVPTMFVRMLNLPEEQRGRYDVSSLRCVVHAAAPCPVDVKRRMIEWFGPKILEYYAGSEGNGFCLVNSQQWLDHPGTVGKPLFGAVHILGEDQEELPQGEIGTIYFGGGAPFQYHKDPEKSRSAVSKQGYSTLGDFGYVDKDGFVYIADRRTDLILSGGVNIYPRETEEALLLHPAVLDVAVIGVPSEEFGQDVLAVVELKPGIAPSEALSAELITFCRSKISHIKCPRRVDFGALPRTETGKLLRRKLKDKYAAAAAQ